MIRTRYGLLKVPDAGSDLIGRHLVRYGEWAWLEAEFVSTVIADGARVLDAGAFVGTFGLGLAANRPLGFLCCVEANPRVIPLLDYNMAGNANCLYTVVNGLVTGPCRRAGARTVTKGNLGATSYAELQPNSSASNLVTIADLRAQTGPFDLVKLDIEGMEREALLGDAEVLRSGKVTLWLECNEDRRSLELCRLLMSWGLDVFYFAFPSFNPGNIKADAVPIYPWAYEAGLLVAPLMAPALTPNLEASGCMLAPVRSVEELTDLLWRTPRWGLPEWQGATSLPDLAARVGRSLTEQSRQAFPVQDEASAPQTVWTRLRQAEAALDDARQAADSARQQHAQCAAAGQEAERLAAERLTMLEAERDLRGVAQQEAAVAARQVAAQLDDLEAERRARHEAEQSLAAAQDLAAQQQDHTWGLHREIMHLVQEVGEAFERCEASEQQVQDLEQSLVRATARGLSHLSALGSERDHAAEREGELAAQHAREMSATLCRLDAAERLAAAHQLAQHAADAQARRSEAAVRAMQASTMWRMLEPARGVLNRWPRVHALLRPGAP